MRILLLSLLATTICVPAYAQEALSVRTGEHRGYTRLVFDWPENVTYNVQEEQGRFTITFDKAASVNTAVKGKNINGMTVQSQDPLTVVVDSPAGAKLRSFSVRSRVVMDVYDPEGTPSEPPAQAPENETPSNTQTPVQAPATSQASAPSSAPQTDPAPASVSAEDSVQTPDEKELEAVQKAVRNVENVVAEVINQKERALQAAMNARASEAAQEQTQAAENAEEIATQAPSAGEETPPEPIIAKAAEQQINANKFTIASTKSVGMAVFENFSEIWMVGDRDDAVIRPQISGPDQAFFSPLSTHEIQRGQGYSVPAKQGASIRAEGGGLLWNVIISDRAGTDMPKPIDPVRQNVQSGKVRGGSVLYPFVSSRRVIEVPDPMTGLMLKVVTVEDAADFAGSPREFVEFSVLASPLGLAIRPKVEDLSVEITDEGVLISRPSGLSILSQDQVSVVQEAKMPKFAGDEESDNRIFNFDDWRMGGLSALNENRMIILSSMPDMTHGTQIENLITLAKMQLANGRGAEALGFLQFAANELPELEQNPEFLALRGVASAFDWKTDEGFEDLSSPILDEYDEADIWRAFALADLGDWQQAYEILPSNLSVIKDYPDEIRNRLVIVLAEIYLRAGERQKAEQLFALISNKDQLNLAHDAALKYLKGEAARQKDDIETTKKLWEELAAGKDDLYRVKAGLALTRLKVDKGEMSPSQAIDSLERLRYAWRGDELEANVGYWLGRTYFEAGEYVKGLKIMRDAATLVPDTVLGQRITSDMASMFTDFYVGETLGKVSPLDAVSLYQEFTELVPAGSQGNQVISNLAEHLVRADLLERAAGLLTYQIDHRLSGDEAARTATRLAAIQLIDKNGTAALKSLEKAEGFLKSQPETVATQERFDELALLRARALSQEGKTTQALAIIENLKPNPSNNRLRADIAWRNGYWDDAGYALEDVILDENISLTRPLSDEHASLILQRAVALNLAGDRIGVNNLRQKYETSMSQTSKARLFEVVTRPRVNSGLADRETLLSTVSEVDLFGDFLNSYREADPNAKSN